MTSKIIVNQIEGDVGVSSVTFNDTIYGNVEGNLTGNVTGNLTGDVTVTSGTLSGISSVSTTNLTVNGNTYPSVGSLSNRNLVINGAMVVAQRSTSVSSIITSGYYTIDRQQIAFVPDGGVLTESQSTDAPEDFAYSRKLEVTTAGGTSGWLIIAYHFEGKDLYSINKGTAAAKPLTLSFGSKQIILPIMWLNY